MQYQMIRIPLNLIEFKADGFFAGLGGTDDRKLEARWEALTSDGYEIHSFEIIGSAAYFLLQREVPVEKKPVEQKPVSKPEKKSFWTKT